MREPTPFPVNAAKFSWMAPICALVLGMMSQMFITGAQSQGNKVDPMMPLIFSGLSALLIVGGVVAGFVALLGVSKYGSKGIVIPAVIGIVVNVALIVLAMQAIERVRELKRSQSSAPIEDVRSIC